MDAELDVGSLTQSNEMEMTTNYRYLKQHHLMNVCLQNAIKDLSKKEDGELSDDNKDNHLNLEKDQDSFDESSGDEIQ